METSNCFLCMSSYFICVNDEDLFVKIKKYLQIDLPALTALPAYVCAYCIESIEQFHEYYERVKSIQFSKTKSKSPDKIHLIEVGSKSNSEHREEYYHEEEEEETPKDLKLDPVFVPAAPKKNKNPNRDKRLVQTKMSKLRKLKKEMESLYKMVECPLCKDGCLHAGLKVIKKHFKECHAEPPFINCCGKEFLLADTFRLRRHVTIHTQPESCKCDICNKILSSPRHMRLHRELHIPMSERTIECKECGRKCSGSSELYRHFRSIHSPQASVCNICGKEFRRRVTFRLHMKTAHGDKKTYICEVCTRTYKSAASLNHHIKTVDTNNYSPKTKQCPVCGKWMGALYVSNHILRCHDNATPYDCPLCDKKFKLPGDVRSHLISHSEERPYTCSFCESAFKTKAALRSHTSQHTGGNPIKCPYCNKMISSYSNYLAHRRRMHSEEHQKETMQLNTQSQTESDIFPKETVAMLQNVC